MDDRFASLAVSPSALEGWLACRRPVWTVESVRGIRGSANSLYDVTVEVDDRRRRLVCKCRQGTSAAAFRPEPHLLAVLAERTAIPAPEPVLVAEDGPDGTGPLFCMERLPGECVAGRVIDLPTAVRERVAADAGRFLGELHALGSFDRFGDLRLSRDVEHDDAGLVAPSARITVTEDAPRTWPDRLEALSAWFLDHLDERVADLRGPLGSFLDERGDGVGDPPAVLTTNDYTYWNLLLDPSSGETTGVLDFEDEWTAAPGYSLAAAVDRVSGLAPLGSESRRRVRAALLAGYDETNDLEDLAWPGPAGDLYRVATRLPALAFLESTARGLGIDEPEALAARHRAFLGELL